MATIIQQRRDTSVNWAATDPIMAQGEIGVDLTLNKYKIGDGVTAWSGLAFPTGGGSAIAVLDEGVSVTAAAVSFDYVGDNVVVTDAGSGVLTVTHTTPAQIAANAASIVTLDADAITQNAVIALNTAKTGITVGQAADIVTNNAKISYTDAAAVTANTAKVGITVGQAADIVSNNAKISYTDAAAVALNTAKVSYDDAAAVALNTAKVSYDDAAAVAANTAKVGITPAQASAITANTAKVTYDDAAAVALNTAKVTYDDAAAVALNTAKISYTDAAAVALNTAKVSVPAGGTTGQVLSKVSATDHNLQWSTGGGGGGGDAYLSGAQTFLALNEFSGGLESYSTYDSSVRLGKTAGASTQGQHSVAIGNSSANNGQGTDCVAVGKYSGNHDQGDDSIAIGSGAGFTDLGEGSVAVGYQSNNTGSGAQSVSLGQYAGFLNSGVNSLAIGWGAGYNNSGDNSIYISTKGLVGQDTSPDTVHIATPTASLDYRPADGWTATTPSGTVPFGDVNTTTTNTLEEINTFEKITQLAGINITPIPLNGAGSTMSVPAISNTSTQNITGTGTVYGQSLPSLVSDTGTYNITKASFYSTGRLFNANPTINLTGANPFGLSGPYTALAAWPTINKTHTTATIFLSQPMRVQTTISNPGGGGAFTATEWGFSAGSYTGVNVTCPEMVGFKSQEPALGSGSTIGASVGVSVDEKVTGTYNAGYSYGSVQTTAGNYAFDSYGSTHPVRFGGGVVNKVTQWASANDFQLTQYHHTVYVQDSQGSAGDLLLPPTASAAVGQTYVLFNDHATAVYLIPPSGSHVQGNTYAGQINSNTGATFTCVGVTSGGSVGWIRS